MMMIDVLRELDVVQDGKGDVRCCGGAELFY